MKPPDPRPPPKRVAGMLVIPLLVVATTVAAQTPLPSQVAGFVVEDEDNSPVAGALVIVKNGPDTDADALGRFLIGYLVSGRHEIMAVGPGCRVVRGSFQVEPGETKLLKLVLPPFPERPVDSRSGGGSGVVITRAQLESSRAPNLLEAILDRVPLMGAGGTASALRGGSSAEVALLVDGVRVSGALERLRYFRVEDVARVEIHRSATAGLAYGPNMSGGLIIVTTRTSQPRSDTPPQSCRLPW